MAGFSQRLTSQFYGVQGRPGAVAAVPNALLAFGFLALTMGHLLGTEPLLPGEVFLVAWCFLELAALWFLPVIYVAFRFWGERGVGVLVKTVLPVAAALSLIPGIVLESPSFLAAGYFLVFAHNKAISFWVTSSTHDTGERLLGRVMVAGFSWILSVLASALVLVCARLIFAPRALEDGGMVAGTLLLSAVFYFSILAAIELIMPRFPTTNAPEPQEQPSEPCAEASSQESGSTTERSRGTIPA